MWWSLSLSEIRWVINAWNIIKSEKLFELSSSLTFLRPDAENLYFAAGWLETCEFADPEFFKCSTRSVHGLFQHLLGGIEGVEGLDSIDPMIIDRIRILQGEGPVSVNASLSKVKVLGFSKVKVVENQVSSKDYSWVTTIKLPKMRLEGNYHMMGRILVIPLNVSFICNRRI